MQGSARNGRQYVAADLPSSQGCLDLTTYLSYHGIDEDTCQRLYSDAHFQARPRWDRLVGGWPGVPYLKQYYPPRLAYRAAQYVRLPRGREALAGVCVRFWPRLLLPQSIDSNSEIAAHEVSKSGRLVVRKARQEDTVSIGSLFQVFGIVLPFGEGQKRIAETELAVAPLEGHPFGGTFLKRSPKGVDGAPEVFGTGLQFAEDEERIG